jgi:sucrose-6-phosphate hydrolase SacC (GH32 family)
MIEGGGVMGRLKIIVLTMCLVRAFTAVHAQEVAHFAFDEATGVMTTVESVHNTTFSILNKYNRPERIAGVAGNALRLDATSTWAFNNSFALAGIQKQLTIESWYTTESFAPEIGAIVSQENGTGGFSLEVGPFGNVSLAFFADGTRFTLKSEKLLEKYKWNYVVATIDLDAKIARVLVNNEQWAKLDLPALYNSLTLAASPFYIGRHSVYKENGGFIITALNGAVDEVSFSSVILPDVDIAARYAAHSSIVPDLTIDPALRHAGDFLRPQFHAMPNTSWTNECYGMTFDQGRYHMFFQKNPNGPFLFFMHWGHLSSPDLVNWTEEKIALAPSPGFDSYGMWSGTTTVDQNQKPVIIYTGVDGVKAGIGLAYPNDDNLVSWKKFTGNPVIAGPPSNFQHMDFRDPFVWKVGSTYYMIVGSGLQNNGGGILFTYKSTDLKTWQTITPLYRSADVANNGVFWEMPFFKKINDKDEYILQVLPTPNAGKRAKSIYWVGKFTGERFTPYFSKPKELEVINENLLAPAVGDDEQGRPYYIGIIPEDRNSADQVKAGWRHTFSVPRVMRLLKDSTLGYYPHPNLCRLRGAESTVTNRKILRNTNFNIPEFEGNQVEMDFKVKADSASRFIIQVLKNADTQEFTSLVFDLKKNVVGLDRRFSTLSNALKDNRESSYVFDHKDTISVNIFIDHSIVEIFVDNLVVFSCRAYPSRETSNKIDFIVSDGAAEIIEAHAWQMAAMRTSNGAEVCEPDPATLPDALRKVLVESPITGIETSERRSSFFIYPNPASDTVHVLYKNGKLKKKATLTLYAADGATLEKHVLNTAETTLSLGHFRAGIYYARIEHSGSVTMQKIIITK